MSRSLNLLAKMWPECCCCGYAALEKLTLQGLPDDAPGDLEARFKTICFTGEGWQVRPA
jgi:hypothetical protein